MPDCVKEYVNTNSIKLATEVQDGPSGNRMIHHIQLLFIQDGWGPLMMRKSFFYPCILLGRLHNLDLILNPGNKGHIPHSNRTVCFEISIIFLPNQKNSR